MTKNTIFRHLIYFSGKIVGLESSNKKSFEHMNEVRLTKAHIEHKTMESAEKRMNG